MTKNYNLFDKSFNRIAKATINKFGSSANVLLFLEALTQSGNVVAAVKKVEDIPISPLQIHRVISKDRYLAKCVNMALSLANEIAEGVLYNRAINGYEELSYDRNGECTGKKKKYCSKSLLEYLKANSPKYQNSGRSTKTPMGKEQHTEDASNQYEIESYGEEAV